WGDLARAREAVQQGAERVVLEGLWGSAKALALIGVLPAGRPACIITPPGLGVPRAVDDLRAFATLTALKAAGEIVAFPAPHAARGGGGADREEEAGGAALRERLLRGEPLWLVTTPRGATGALPEPEGVRRQRLTIAVGEAIDREALAEHLAGAGYERAETVSDVGQWSVRGGIVDVFSPARPTP